MIHVREFVSSGWKTRGIGEPMRTVQELRSFKDHLYDMLVAMMFRSNASVKREEEDVHSGGRLTSLMDTNLFLTPVERRHQTENDRIRVRKEGEDVEQQSNALKDKQWTLKGRADHRPTTTEAKNPIAERIRCRDYNLNVS